jgi:regulator of protease activity HflC (stomatin/prohibitin superfamily)
VWPNLAALDFANAVERQADGEKRAEIKKAEGIKQAKILAAEGDAEAIRLVNEAANTYFVGNALELQNNDNILPEVSPENIVAMFEALVEHSAHA